MDIFLFLLEHIYVMWKEHKNGNMTTDILITNLKERRNNDKKIPNSVTLPLETVSFPE
jgi:hypothetical protein